MNRHEPVPRKSSSNIRCFQGPPLLAVSGLGVTACVRSRANPPGRFEERSSTSTARAGFVRQKPNRRRHGLARNWPKKRNDSSHFEKMKRRTTFCAPCSVSGAQIRTASKSPAGGGPGTTRTDIGSLPLASIFDQILLDGSTSNRVHLLRQDKVRRRNTSLSGFTLINLFPELNAS